MILVTILMSLLFIPAIAAAHSGGLDRRGGHIDHSTGIWHSHSGGGGGDGFGWYPMMVPSQPRVEPPSPKHRAARTAYRTQVRENDTRRHLAAAQKAAADRDAAAEDPEALESRAAAKLKLAKDLLEKGHTGLAVKWLKEIVQEFPQTKAGEEAKALLAQQGVNMVVWYWRMRGVYGILGADRWLGS